MLRSKAAAYAAAFEDICVSVNSDSVRNPHRKQRPKRVQHNLLVEPRDHQGDYAYSVKGTLRSTNPLLEALAQ